MAEWHVSGSESEGEPAEKEGMKVGGLHIPPSRVAELLQTIEKRNVLELECLSNVSRRRERSGRHKRRKKGQISSPGTSRNPEEVSETASELRSTTSTDLKEGRWTNVSKFDYFHEDSAGTDLSMVRKPKKLPPEHREKKLASLDRIVADLRQQKEQTQELQSTITPDIAMDHTRHTTLLPNRSRVSSSWEGLHVEGHKNESRGAGFGSTPSLGVRLPTFSFDEDSDPNSPNSEEDMKMSVLSQINRVEKLLDDGLT